MYVIAKKFYYDWAFYIFLSCVNLLFSRSPFLKLQTFDDGYDFWWWRGNTYILLKNMCVIHLKLNHICIKAKKEWLTKHKVFLFFHPKSICQFLDRKWKWAGGFLICSDCKRWLATFRGESILRNSLLTVSPRYQDWVKRGNASFVWLWHGMGGLWSTKVTNSCIHFISANSASFYLLQ